MKRKIVLTLLMIFLLFCVSACQPSSIQENLVGKYILDADTYILITQNTVIMKNTYIGKTIVLTETYEAKATVQETNFRVSSYKNGVYKLVFVAPVNVACYTLDGEFLSNENILLVFELNKENKTIILMGVTYIKTNDNQT